MFSLAALHIALEKLLLQSVEKLITGAAIDLNAKGKCMHFSKLFTLKSGWEIGNCCGVESYIIYNPWPTWLIFIHLYYNPKNK